MTDQTINAVVIDDNVQIVEVVLELKHENCQHIMRYKSATPGSIPINGKKSSITFSN
jgi:hypothetical protein